MSTAIILDGRAPAARIRTEVKARAAALSVRGIRPKLAIFAGEGDEPGLHYARVIERVGKEAGVEVMITVLERAGSSEAVRRASDALAAAANDARLHGILIQRPMPAPLDSKVLSEAIPPSKDVDGAHPVNLGLLAAGTPNFAPATAAAAMELLRLSPHWPPAGARAAVIGRSVVVGRPLALMLVAADATVTLCHSRTRDLAEVTRGADIVAVAIGKAGFVSGAMIKPGATVIDVGTNLVQGKVVGDVDAASVANVAAALTPVPGGVGPVTAAILLRNVIEAAEQISKM